MYYYSDGKKQLWTSNEVLALSRARTHDSEVYRVEFEVEKKFY